MRNLPKILFLLLGCLAWSHAQNGGDLQSDATKPGNGGAQSETDDNFQRFTALPILGYSEETELQYGAMTILFFKPSFKGGQTSEIDLAAYGSTRKQFQFLAVPYFYLFHDQVSGWLDFRYQDWFGHYYGLGNDPDFDDYRSFNRKTYAFSTLVESNFGLPTNFKQIKYGLTTDFTHTDVHWRSYDGSLLTPDDEPELPDSQNGWRSGIGYHLTFDSRDNTNWSRHGYLAQWDHRFYSDALGDYSFTYQELDLRGFSEFIWNTSMAVGILWQRVDGNVPFDMLAGPDGIKRFRGVESKFFRDNQALILQTEFRKELFWRLAGDIFFEGGKAGKYFSDLLREGWHRAVGFGGQLALNLKEKLYARGELSWVDFKEIGISVYIREAF